MEQTRQELNQNTLMLVNGKVLLSFSRRPASQINRQTDRHQLTRADTGAGNNNSSVCNADRNGIVVKGKKSKWRPERYTHSLEENLMSTRGCDLFEKGRTGSCVVAAEVIERWADNLPTLSAEDNNFNYFCVSENNSERMGVLCEQGAKGRPALAHIDDTSVMEPYYWAISAKVTGLLFSLAAVTYVRLNSNK